MSEPHTLEHFRSWSKDLVLDNLERWVLEPFQEAFLADVFSGRQACWLVIPEGNGKTTLVAGLVLYHIQHTEAGWVPVAASSRQQAEILYRQAEGFCVRSPKLAAGEWFKCQEGNRRIKCERMRSRIQIFAADDATADGVIPTMAIVEELHRHRNLKLYDTWRGKYGKRSGQTIVISTAGEPGSEFEERRGQIREKAAGREQDGSFVRSTSRQLVMHEWTLQKGDDPEDLEAVARANPFSGVTVDTLREKFEGPDFAMVHWQRFTCNLPTRSDAAAIQEKEWFDAVSADAIPVDCPVWVGLDLGWKYDTTAAVPLWHENDVSVLGAARVLVPPRDGTFMDPQRIRDTLLEIHGRNPIEGVVMDMSDARDIAEWIEQELGSRVVQRNQHIPAKVEEYKHFTEALREGRLKHAGDEALTSHVLNAHARLLPGGDVCFARPVSSRRDPEQQDRRVIDALTSASMVLAVIMANPVSVYDGREPVAA